MRLSIFWFLLVALFGCQQRQEYPISAIEIAPELELQQLVRLNERIKSQPQNLSLRKQRFAINYRLKWPQNAIEDLEFIVKNEGLSFDLYNQAISFYDAYHYFESMLLMLEQWSDFANVETDRHWKSKALIGLGRTREAEYTLWEHLQTNKKNEQELIYISQSFLLLADTAQSIYSMNLLSKLNPGHEILLKEYVPLLLLINQPVKAQQVLANFDINVKDTVATYHLAEMAFQTGNFRKGHQLLRNYEDEQSYLKRYQGFIEEKQLDSASLMADLAIQMDSSSRSLFVKGQLLENQYNRIWPARTYYELSLKMDSTNINARESIANVDRKIAYLRSLKERDSRTPILEISSKKETENE